MDDDDGLMMFMIMVIIFMMLVKMMLMISIVAYHVKPLSCSAIHTHRLCTWDEINVKLLSN